ncbi:MAG TPA: hypothetical protein VFE45_13960, partial [Coriobacteriia bacterium]|nr:hypothetical protein [Coriobacteriia bacterium]
MRRATTPGVDVPVLDTWPATALRDPQHLGQTDEDGHRRLVEREIVPIVVRRSKQRDALVAARMPAFRRSPICARVILVTQFHY